MSSQTADPFCPIYREALEAAPWKDAPSAHAGLLFDKFADAWWHDRKWTFAFDKGDHEKEGHWLKSVFPKAYSASATWKPSKTQDGTSDLEKLLNEACARQRRMVKELGGRVISLTNTDRFVTGMGREHPLENGFAWHHTLGVPYLPGSSVKGMLRAWLREERGQITKDRRGNGVWEETPELEKQFGTQGQVGQVILLDMLPTRPPQLDVDVMTPHYGPYYQDSSGQTPPGDWHSPVPISFLSVAPNQKWQVGIIPGQGAGSLDESTFNSLTEALLEAIEVCGAGAKTAVGYGRFEHDAEAEEQIQRQHEEQQQREQAARQRAAKEAEFKASMAGNSELLQKLKQLQRDQGWVLNAGDQKMISALQQFADQNPNPPQDCLDWIRTLIESIPNYKGVWTAPEETKGKKKKYKYNAEAIRKLVLQLNPQRK